MFYERVDEVITRQIYLIDRPVHHVFFHSEHKKANIGQNPI